MKFLKTIFHDIYLGIASFCVLVIFAVLSLKEKFESARK